jgi:tRNA (cytidine/uridine-2'-O-)-methyltransferase
MINIVLVEPEIPQNTGNIARTCAACGMRLHVVGPTAFEISDRTVKRAGLDYWHMLDITLYENYDVFFRKNTGEFFYCSTKAGLIYADALLDKTPLYLVFGKETKGLDEALLRRNPEQCVRLPMLSDARSLNLSNAVAVGAYEVLRQWSFPKLKNFGILHDE